MIVQHVKAVNICFFGINRALSSTIDSINKYLFDHLKDLSIDYSVYGAFNRFDILSNERSGEVELTTEKNELELINFDSYKYLDQSLFDKSAPWDRVFKYGDAYEQIQCENDLHLADSTTKNIFWSLFCLKSSYSLIPPENLARPTIFLRLDVKILSDIDFLFCFDVLAKKPRKYAFGDSDGVALVPSWHSCDGWNDKFAICTSGNSASTYANRFDHLLSFLDISKHPIHPESYLQLVMQASRVEVLPIISTRMARIRANGRQAHEDFSRGSRVFDSQSESLSSVQQFASSTLKSSQAELTEVQQALADKENYIASLEVNLSSANDERLLAVRQLHLVQEELEHYFLLGCEQSRLLEASAKLQSMSVALLWKEVNRLA